MAMYYGTDKCRIEFLHEGFRKLLCGVTDKGPGVDEAVRKVTEAIAEDAMKAAGLTRDDYIVDVYETEWPTSYEYPGRAMGFVETWSKEAKRSEAVNKTLIRAAMVNRGVIS